MHFYVVLNGMQMIFFVMLFLCCADVIFLQSCGNHWKMF